MTTSSHPMLPTTVGHDHFLTPAFVLPRGRCQPASFPQTQLPGVFNRPASPMLPSLEGILKRIHDDVPAREPVQYSPSAQQHHAFPAREHRMSPVAAMPPLRAMISPSSTKTVVLPTSMHQHQVAAPFSQGVPSQHPYAYDNQTSRKRSWVEASYSHQEPFLPIKERAVASMSGVVPVRAVAPQRSRASKYCKIEGCERVSQRNNLCHSHGGKRLCKEDGCNSKDRGNGYCIKHGGGKICSMSGCEKKARRKGLCTQHFRVSDDNSEESMSPYCGSAM
ncbi:TPA: hypothetical protein N0F65_009797 [Lagenidium giganteum]|uniref:WRKY19-like zinc finger domain-containing protein n=1 Tax=Lagenidium giganteum TaxID=4803 RepID=A0AAV2YJ34_9STRA|nr:TPA: hypothetical protein N0F65_009797 [Lagenidium giganteum]